MRERGGFSLCTKNANKTDFYDYCFKVFNSYCCPIFGFRNINFSRNLHFQFVMLLSV